MSGFILHRHQYLPEFEFLARVWGLFSLQTLGYTHEFVHKDLRQRIDHLKLKKRPTTLLYANVHFLSRGLQLVIDCACALLTNYRSMQRYKPYDMRNILQSNIKSPHGKIQRGTDWKIGALRSVNLHGFGEITRHIRR